MSDRCSKEDEVQKLSTFIFVTNFPDSFNAKDLWRVCNQYGTVIDTFIPNRRSKLNKRFGFATNNVFIEERITWLDIEGVPLKAWTNNTFKRIASKWGEILYDEDQEEFCFHSKRICVLTKYAKTILESFKIIIQGKVFWICAKEAGGRILDFVEEDENESVYDDVVSEEGTHEGNEGPNNSNPLVGDYDVEEVSETIFEKANSQTPNKDGCNVEHERTQSDDPFSIL
uniref:Glucose-methanol-choline oxidoreductase, FAD/NAD(P)-binding domain protein n=1 Tax=Tanacetum cinerariifolium TaxID=118510 RepID=A0A6L2KA39_TANCI|nr:glucose-methanol-choline oxidoreductase, FAD/NAD(P)-binding domain protein [Tanacetum cinerariifolium]